MRQFLSAFLLVLVVTFTNSAHAEFTSERVIEILSNPTLVGGESPRESLNLINQALERAPVLAFSYPDDALKIANAVESFAFRTDNEFRRMAELLEIDPRDAKPSHWQAAAEVALNKVIDKIDPNRVGLDSPDGKVLLEKLRSLPLTVLQPLPSENEPELREFEKRRRQQQFRMRMESIEGLARKYPNSKKLRAVLTASFLWDLRLWGKEKPREKPYLANDQISRLLGITRSPEGENIIDESKLVLNMDTLALHFGTEEAGMSTFARLPKSAQQVLLKNRGFEQVLLKNNEAANALFSTLESRGAISAEERVGFIKSYLSAVAPGTRERRQRAYRAANKLVWNSKLARELRAELAQSMRHADGLEDFTDLPVEQRQKFLRRKDFVDAVLTDPEHLLASQPRVAMEFLSAAKRNGSSQSMADHVAHMVGNIINSPNAKVRGQGLGLVLLLNSIIPRDVLEDPKVQTALAKTISEARLPSLTLGALASVFDRSLRNSNDLTEESRRFVESALRNNPIARSALLERAGEGLFSKPGISPIAVESIHHSDNTKAVGEALRSITLHAPTLDREAVKQNARGKLLLENFRVGAELSGSTLLLSDPQIAARMVGMASLDASRSQQTGGPTSNELVRLEQILDRPFVTLNDQGKKGLADLLRAKPHLISQYLIKHKKMPKNEIFRMAAIESLGNPPTVTHRVTVSKHVDKMALNEEEMKALAKQVEKQPVLLRSMDTTRLDNTEIQYALYRSLKDAKGDNRWHLLSALIRSETADRPPYLEAHNMLADDPGAFLDFTRNHPEALVVLENTYARKRVMDHLLADYGRLEDPQNDPHRIMAYLRENVRNWKPSDRGWFNELSKKATEPNAFEGKPALTSTLRSLQDTLGHEIISENLYPKLPSDFSDTDKAIDAMVARLNAGEIVSDGEQDYFRRRLLENASLKNLFDSLEADSERNAFIESLIKAKTSLSNNDRKFLKQLTYNETLPEHLVRALVPVLKNFSALIDSKGLDGLFKNWSRLAHLPLDEAGGKKIQELKQFLIDTDSRKFTNSVIHYMRSGWRSAPLIAALIDGDPTTPGRTDELIRAFQEIGVERFFAAGEAEQQSAEKPTGWEPLLLSRQLDPVELTRAINIDDLNDRRIEKLTDWSDSQNARSNMLLLKFLVDENNTLARNAKLQVGWVKALENETLRRSALDALEAHRNVLGSDAKRELAQFFRAHKGNEFAIFGSDAEFQRFLGLPLEGAGVGREAFVWRGKSKAANALEVLKRWCSRNPRGQQ